MPQLEHIEATEKRLWTAADTLRANANYVSHEHFLLAMGLVFLCYAHPTLPSPLYASGSVTG